MAEIRYERNLVLDDRLLKGIYRIAKSALENANKKQPSYTDKGLESFIELFTPENIRYRIARRGFQ